MMLQYKCKSAVWDWVEYQWRRAYVQCRPMPPNPTCLVHPIKHSLTLYQQYKLKRKNLMLWLRLLLHFIKVRLFVLQKNIQNVALNNTETGLKIQLYQKRWSIQRNCIQHTKVMKFQIHYSNIEENAWNWQEHGKCTVTITCIDTQCVYIVLSSQRSPKMRLGSNKIFYTKHYAILHKV